MPLPMSYSLPGSKYYRPNSGAPNNNGNSGLVNQYNLYGGAVHGAQNDYSGIMDSYRRLLSQKSGQQVPNLADYNPEKYGKPQSYTPENYGTPQQYTSGNMAKPQEFKPNTYGAPENFSPLTREYSQSGDLTDAIGKLKNLSETGGYSEQGIADLRERGVSPLRSVYASAQRDIERNQAIQGSSNSYAALKSKMARELSDKIAGATQNVNAGIAQNVAGNKIAITPAYANVTENQSNLKNSIDQGNTSILNSAQFGNVQNRNRVNEANTDLTNQGNLFNIGRTDAYNRDMFNRTNDVNDRNVSNVNDVNRANVDMRNSGNLRNIGDVNSTNRANTDIGNEARRINMELPIKRSQLQGEQGNEIQRILQGMQGLYGTTPALASLFGNQALSGASLQNNINQGNNQNSMEMILNLIRQLSGRS